MTKLLLLEFFLNVLFCFSVELSLVVVVVVVAVIYEKCDVDG